MHWYQTVFEFQIEPSPPRKKGPALFSRRIYTIVSNSKKKTERLEELHLNFKKWNYPNNLINDGIKKALTIDRENLLIFNCLNFVFRSFLRCNPRWAPIVYRLIGAALIGIFFMIPS